MQESNVITATTQVGSYLDSFTEFEKRAAGHNQPWLRALREDAFARFCATGFPTTHDEDWRFTNVAAIARTQFVLPPIGAVQISGADLQPWRMEEAAVELVFIDGQFAPELSMLDN